jgi:hypothetical protein
LGGVFLAHYLLFTHHACFLGPIGCSQPISSDLSSLIVEHRTVPLCCYLSIYLLGQDEEQAGLHSEQIPKVTSTPSFARLVFPCVINLQHLNTIGLGFTTIDYQEKLLKDDLILSVG